MSAQPRLKAVPTDEAERDVGDIYAADRLKALDLDRWRRMHERCERREPIFIPDKPRVHTFGRLKVERGAR